MFTSLRFWLKNRRLLKEKKGDFELDQLGKLLFGLFVLIILIYFVSVYLGGKIDAQGEDLTNTFEMLE